MHTRKLEKLRDWGWDKEYLMNSTFAAEVINSAWQKIEIKIVEGSRGKKHILEN